MWISRDVAEQQVTIVFHLSDVAALSLIFQPNRTDISIVLATQQTQVSEARGIMEDENTSFPSLICCGSIGDFQAPKSDDPKSCDNAGSVGICSKGIELTLLPTALCHGCTRGALIGLLDWLRLPNFPMAADISSKDLEPVFSNPAWISE